MVFLTGLLPASCHKESPQQKAPPAVIAIDGTTNSASAVNTKSFERKLGNIVLTNLNDTFVQFSTGECFTLTPKLIDKNILRINLSVESKDEYGDTHDFAATQVITKPGQPVDVAIGKYTLSFIPEVAADH